MPTNSTIPPLPTQSRGLVYAVLGVLLLGGAGTIWWLTKGSGPEDPLAAGTTEDAGTRERPNVDIVLPDEEVDAGVIEAVVDSHPGASGSEHRGHHPAGRTASRSTCTGSIPAAAASRAINRNAVRACYERRLKGNNQLSGRISVQIVVGSSGHVSGVQVGGSLQDPTVFSCVRGVASRWIFPAPTGGNCAVVSVPFTLTPRM